MSLAAAVTTIVVLDVAVLGFVAWMMCHPRHLIPHGTRQVRFATEERIFVEVDRPELILESVV